MQQLGQLKFSDIPEPGQELIRIMQRIQYGSIDQLKIVNGSPDLSTLKITRDIKFGNRNEPKDHLPYADHLLKQQHIEFFQMISVMRCTTIGRIEIQNGLPFRMNISEQVSLKKASNQ
jgi:hypothetical protein